MKKAVLVAILLWTLFTIAIFSQSRDSYIYEFLGQSENSIQKIWGYPERTEINNDGFLLWYYTFDYSQRIFYFDNNVVEMCQSILVVNDYNYAVQLADALENSIKAQGFWVYSQDKNRIVYTNGRVELLAQITRYDSQYIFQLIAYR